MSKEARAWVKAFSPLTGIDYSVHFTIADSVDKANMLYMKQSCLAGTARVSMSTVKRVMAVMMDAGLLERVDTPEQEKIRRASHDPLRFRLLFPVVEQVVSLAQAELANRSDADNSIGHADPANQDNSIGQTGPPAEPIGQPEPSTTDPIGHTELATPNPIGHADLSKGTGTCSATGTIKATGTNSAANGSTQIELFGGSRGEPSVPAGPNAVARLILDDWWKRQDPKPQQPYIAVLKVMTKALKDGWTERDLRDALDTVPIISGGALDYWRKRKNGNNGMNHQSWGPNAKPADQLANESMERIAKTMGYDR